MNIEDLEDTLITTLKAAMPYLKYVGTYQGELDEQKILQFAINCPAVLIYMEKNKYTNRGNALKWQNPKITILVCDTNLRGNKAARHGDLNNPGTYKMLRDVFDTIYEKTLGLDIQPFDIEDEGAIINTSKMSVYGALYITQAAKN